MSNGAHSQPRTGRESRHYRHVLAGLLVYVLPMAVMAQIDTADLFANSDRFSVGGFSATLGSIQAADFDGDGNLDLVSAHGTLNISMGQGDGTFEPPRVESSVSGAMAVSVADLDNDGRLDIAATGGTMLHLLKGNGDGTFQPLQELEISSSFQLRAVAVTDLGTDGSLEIIVSDFSDDSIVIAKRSDSGEYVVDRRIPAGVQPEHVTSTDINGDGLPDIAVAGSSPALLLLLAQSDGSFTRVEITSFRGSGNAQTVALGDINGDGSTDLVAGLRFTDDGAELAYGLGDGEFVQRGGNFAEPGPGVISMAGGAEQIVLADLDGDQKPDLVMPTNTAGLAIAMNIGAGVFSEAQALATDGSSFAAVAGDFDNDGDIDVAALNRPSFLPSSIDVFLNDGSGALQSAGLIGFSRTSNKNSALAVTDLNQDGLEDIMGLSGDAFISNQSGGLDAPKFPSSIWALEEWGGGPGPSGTAVAMIDLDGDMFPDPVRVALLRSTNLAGCPILESEINLGRTGATGLVAVESIDIQAAGLIGPLDLAVADYDADGRDDIVVLSDDFCDEAAPGKLSILFGEDEQQFSDPVLIAEAGAPAAVVSGDIDGDNDIDLIYADFETDAVRVHLNNGNGTFAPVSAYPAGEDPLRLKLDDIDHDGAPDIVTANPVEGGITVLLNAGNGTFGSPSSFPAGPNPGRLVVDDFDGDGNRDVATLSRPDRSAEEHQNIHVLRGSGVGTFAPPVAFVTASTGQALVAGDFTGDGLPDLASSHFIDPNLGDIRGLAILANQRSDRTIPEIEVRHDGHLVPDEDLVPTRARGTDFGIALFDSGVVSRRFEIANIAPPSLELTAIPAVQIRGANPSQFVIAEQPASSAIAPDSSTEFIVEFQPDSPGTKRAIVEIRNSDIGEDPYTFAVSGAGIVKPEQLDLFATPIPSLDVGIDNDAIVATDFDGDDIPDVATISTDEAALYIHRNDGSATFELVQTLETPTNPIRIAVLDLDQDGRDDLAVLTRAFMTSSVATFLTQSDGTLVPDQTIQVDNGPASLAIGDIDGDGLEDIAIASERDDSLNLLFGTGSGLEGPEIIALPVDSAPSSVAMADFDDDGSVDLAFGSTERRDIGLLLAGDNGNFENTTVAILETRAFVLDGLAALDADLDGIPDLYTQQGIVHFSNGDGTFSPEFGVTTGVDTGARTQVVDMDLDGILDVAGANAADQVIGLISPPVGLVPRATHRRPPRFFPSTTATAVADFNQDGVPDLVSATDPAIFVSLGRGDGVLFAPRKLTALSVGNLLRGRYLFADFNGDGREDILKATSIVLGSPREEFGQVFVFPAVGDGPIDIAQSRLGPSGRIKIYAADRASGDVSVVLPEIRNLAAEVQVPLSSVTRIPSLNSAPDTVAVGDVNGDGIPDFATAQIEENTISMHIGVSENEFQVPTELTIAGATDVSFDQATNVELEFADLNSDGNDDLVALHSGPPLDEMPDSIFVFRSNGDGTFAPRQNIDVGNEPSEMVVIDLNDDTILDIAVTNARDGTISIFEGTGNGEFFASSLLEAAVLPPDPTNPTRAFTIEAADYDSDGDIDLVVSIGGPPFPHSVLFRNIGSGNFSAPILFAAIGDHRTIDIDDNEMPDLMLSAEMGMLNMAVPPPPNPEILVFGEGNRILNGDSNPSSEDGTDFGTLNIGNATTQEFVIFNTGTAILEVSDISINGAAAAGFGVVSLPATSIAPDEQVTVAIEFSPTNIGTRAADVSIEHNDEDQNPFNFAIEGEGIDPTGELLFKNGFE